MNSATTFKYFPQAVLTVLMLVVVLTMSQTAAQLSVTWSSGQGAYSSGWLVCFLFGYTLWIRQERVFDCKTQPQIIYLALIAVAAFFGIQGSSESLQYLALPLFAVGIYSLIFGTRAGFQLSLVMAIVLFALPIWSWLQPPLQTLASVSVAAFFDFIQTPVFLEGNRITVPAGIFEVKNGCSGLNYFLVANCTAYTASLWAELKGPKFVAQMVAATAFAIVVNWLRIGTIIYVGNATDMQSSLVTDHVTFGWILFVCLFVPYVFFVLPHSPSAMATKKGETL